MTDNLGSPTKFFPRDRPEHTFKVGHHRMSTDPTLVHDEVCKAAYRANRTAITVACIELAETRADYLDLRERLAKMALEFYKAAEERAARNEDGWALPRSVAQSIANEIGYEPWKE